MRKKRNTQSRLDAILDIPKELSTDIPKITVLGFEQILIENHKGILEYQDYYIRLNTCIGIININGFNLTLEQVTEDDISIKGKIESVSIERTE